MPAFPEVGPTESSVTTNNSMEVFFLVFGLRSISRVFPFGRKTVLFRIWSEVLHEVRVKMSSGGGGGGGGWGGGWGGGKQKINNKRKYVTGMGFMTMVNQKVS